MDTMLAVEMLWPALAAAWWIALAYVVASR